MREGRVVFRYADSITCGKDTRFVLKGGMDARSRIVFIRTEKMIPFSTINKNVESYKERLLISLGYFIKDFTKDFFLSILTPPPPLESLCTPL